MKIARLVHPGFWFGKSSLEEALQLAKRGVGGFCLYGGTRDEVAQFTQCVRAVSPHYLLISADYEDGLGRWLADTPLLASNLALGAANDENFAFEKGFLTARQARSLGVDWVFAPVVDLADNPLNPIVNTRAFSATPQQVISLAGAFLDGLHHGGALGSLKHFPGHGDTTTDSHVALPVLHKSRAQLDALELKPFQALLAKADSVMAGHLLLPKIDAENPASLSQKIIGQILRQEMQYTGCVLTDALLMKAIGDEKQAALQALNAGANILLVPQNPAELIDFLETQSITPEILAQSEKLQNALCNRVAQHPALTPAEAFAPSDFNQRVAKKAIVQTGNPFVLKPGETVSILETGNTAGQSAEPFIRELKKAGVSVQRYPAQTDKLIILCFRRYQAFSGKIALEKSEQQMLQTAAKNYPTTAAVLLASPWALRGVLEAQTTLYTFCPAPEFQQVAARILLGKETACAQPPITL